MEMRAWRRPLSVEIFSHIVVITINLIVCVRLLRKALEHALLPEFLLGAALAFSSLEWLLWWIGVYSPVADTAFAGLFEIGCRTGIFISNSFLLLFVRAVFRANDKWALVFTGLVVLTTATGLSVGVYLGDQKGFASDRIWIWLELGGSGTALLWCFLEAARHYLKMRRRIPLGLADPVVANRVLLWSCYGGAGLVSQSVEMMGTAIAGATGVYPNYLDAVMSAATSTGAIMLWLAFFPPVGYLRWISRKFTTAAA
jgi:hypothetical protein